MAKMEIATFPDLLNRAAHAPEWFWSAVVEDLDLEFFSPYISGAQRLPNGNTLICEGVHGRIFEVTPARDVVWEYISPFFFDESGRPGVNNWVFRAFRYTAAEIEAARRA